MRDEIFKNKGDISKFVFDKEVAEVFDDMVIRSVPGYMQMIELIGLISRRYVSENSNVYDLGCSTGAATIAVAANIKAKGVKIFAIDNSISMLDSCKKNLKNNKSDVRFIESDINSIEFKNASLVILNLTLQFIETSKRLNLIKKIFHGLIPGGALIVSEKIIHNEPKIDEHLSSLQSFFKLENGYSKSEISRKRKAIENILVPETSQKNIYRLTQAGFENTTTILQCLNFASFLSIKQ